MQVLVERLTGEAGYEHYETSAYAKRGFRCRHNLNYDVRRLSRHRSGCAFEATFLERIARQARYRQPREYMERARRKCGPVEAVAACDIPFEFGMMNALRLGDGFPTALFAERTVFNDGHVLTALDEAEKRGPSRPRPRAHPTDGAGKALSQ